MSRLSPDALKIIEETRHLDAPLPGDKARIRAAIDTVMAPHIDAPTTGASTAATKTLVLKVGAVGGVLLAAAIGITVYRGVEPEKEAFVQDKQTTLPESTVVDREPVDVDKSNDELDFPPVKPRPETESAGEINAPVPKRVRNKKPKKREASPLEEELRLLKAAQKERKQGNIQNALTLLEKHRAQFPSGKLSAEREAARVLTLCAANQREAAIRVAQRFVKRYTNSPLVYTVKQSCAFDTADRNEEVSTSVEGEPDGMR